MATLKELAEMLPAIEWLWPSWIPKGFVTMLAGRQGQGKSYLALSFARNFLLDVPWPDGFRSGKTEKKVLWLDCESAQALLVQRSQEWKLPLDRIVLPDEPLAPIALEDSGDREKISNIVSRENIPFVVIDSLGGSHGLDVNSNRDMSRVLKPLAALARDKGIALFIVHHVRKRYQWESDLITLDNIMGSLAISQFCRSVIVKETVKGVSRLRVEKINICKAPPPVGVSIKDGNVYFARLEGDIDIPVSPFVSPAAEWLIEELGDSPRKSGEVIKEAATAGISWRQLHKAKQELGIVRIGYTWALPNTVKHFHTDPKNA